MDISRVSSGGVRQSARAQRSAAIVPRRPKQQSAPTPIPRSQVGFSANERATRESRHAVVERFRTARACVMEVRKILEAASAAVEGRPTSGAPQVPSAIANKPWTKPLQELVAMLGESKKLTADRRNRLASAIESLLIAVPSLRSPRLAQALAEMGLAGAITASARVSESASVSRLPKQAEVVVIGGSIGGYSAALAAIEAGVAPSSIVVAELRSHEEQNRRQGPGYDAATINFWKKHGVDTSFISTIGDYGIVMTHGHASSTFSERIAPMTLPEDRSTEHHMGLLSIRKAGTGRIFMAEEALRRRLLELGVHVANDAHGLGLELDAKQGGTVQLATSDGLIDVTGRHVIVAAGKNNELLGTLGIGRKKQVESNRINYYATFECDPALNKDVHVRAVTADPDGMPIVISFGSGKYRDVWVLNPTFGDLSRDELDAKMKTIAPKVNIKNGKLLGHGWQIEIAVDLADKIVLGKGVVNLGDSAGSGDFLVGGGANCAVAHAIAAGKLIAGKISEKDYEARVRDITGQFHTLGKRCDWGISLASGVDNTMAGARWLGTKAARVHPLFFWMPSSWHHAIFDAAWGAVHGSVAAVRKVSSPLTLPIVTKLLTSALQLRDRG